MKKRMEVTFCGFSLIEIMLALGVLSFALVSIIGLLNVGLSASKAAQIDTTKAAVTRSILSSLRTDVSSGYSGGTNWFNFDGSTNVGASGAYFQCVVATNAPPAAIPAVNMIAIRIEFQYPLSAASPNRTTNVLNASIVRYP